MVANHATTKTRSTKKLSISITVELDEALDVMCVRTGLSKSRVIENTMRSDEFIAKYIKALRSEYASRSSNGVFAAKPKGGQREKRKNGFGHDSKNNRSKTVLHKLA